MSDRESVNIRYRDLPRICGSRPILIAGPTAAGKSQLALQLASRFDGVVINSDALQVYSCWRILTARPTAHEEKLVPHRLYGHVEHDRRYSVGDWIADVARTLDSLRGRRPVIVGGSGLCFEALTRGLAPIPPIAPEISERYESLLERRGPQSFVEDLLRLDPEGCRKLDLENNVRVRRAWEVLHSTGRSIGAWHSVPVTPLIEVDSAIPIVLECDAGLLAARIHERLRRMVDEGALVECQRMMDRWDPALPSCQAHGARQFIAHLRNSCSLAQAIDEAATVTRQYAKRQRSWHRTRMKKWRRVGVEW
ncbi:MAG: tRNA (adenosine(37)-N6)-dimethylallyltransferase MiaA [Rhodobacteraceae bacterium]|nr:tRNA (adenosine(37)-N6)-dimethylallyltransferase MiaA [Paracoccaceae bacterium]